MMAMAVGTAGLYILTNHTYTGMLVQGKEKRAVEATHEPLVDVGTFDIIQKAFQARAYNVVMQGQSSDNILKGKIICGCCGGKMQCKTIAWINAKEHYEQYVQGEISKEEFRAVQDIANRAKEALIQATESKTANEKQYAMFASSFLPVIGVFHLANL